MSKLRNFCKDFQDYEQISKCAVDLKFILRHQERIIEILTFQWPRGGGGGHATPPNRFVQLFSEMGRASLQTKFLPVGSSLGHLSMKKFFKSDLPSWL